MGQRGRSCQRALLSKALELRAAQAERVPPEVRDPGVWSQLHAVADERGHEHPPLWEVDEGLAHGLRGVVA
ncbi:hypothetical protein VE04_02710, partial [Pseudogymnoascus sp. 24MN13]